MEIALRKIEPSDLPLLYLWENDDTAWPDGAVHNPLSQKDLRDYILSSTGDIYKDGQLRLVIMKGENAIGCIDLYDFDVRNRRAAVGVYIAPSFRRQRYGEQALTLLIDYAKRHLNMRLLYAYVQCANIASTNLFRKQFTPSNAIPSWTLEGASYLFYKKFN